MNWHTERKILKKILETPLDFKRNDEKTHDARSNRRDFQFIYYIYETGGIGL